jgi:hypothetical protein
MAASVPQPVEHAKIRGQGSHPAHHHRGPGAQASGGALAPSRDQPDPTRRASGGFRFLAWNEQQANGKGDDGQAERKLDTSKIIAGG